MLTCLPLAGMKSKKVFRIRSTLALTPKNSSQKPSLSKFQLFQSLDVQVCWRIREKDNAYKNMIEKNRSPHFKFGDGTSQELQTVNRAQYDYKGNPVEIRQTLDENVKLDLKQHHFQYGSHQTDFLQSSKVPINQNQNQTVVDNKDNDRVKIEAKLLLKNSGQRIFGPTNGQQ